MAFKMRGFSAFTKKKNGDPPPTIGKGGEYTTYKTTYYNKAGDKITGIIEENTGKIQKEDDGRRFVMHDDGRKLYIDK
tara:strand:+ start:531 stop:764 length:234 start_codon:yes stop_codon:yes gene_type:complete